LLLLHRTVGAFFRAPGGAQRNRCVSVPDNGTVPQYRRQLDNAQVNRRFPSL
jgi:hypothetical protein